MSTKGIYSALSGAIAQSQRLDTIANNLANVNTPGFKKDTQTFREYLTANEKAPDVMNVPRIPASIESFYDMQGADKSYVDANGTYTNFQQGGLKHTGNAFDLGFDGVGFFEIATPNGIRFTRAGSFSLDGNGQLVTKEGWPVMRKTDPGVDPAARVIRLPNSDAVSVSPNGDIYQGETLVARLSVVEIPNKDTLSKVGNNLYEFKSNAQPEVVDVAVPSIKQGFVEMSNVNIVEEMTEMIQATRVFESTQKAISAYDQMNDKLVNIVGKSGL